MFGKMSQDKWGANMPVHAPRSPQYPTFQKVLMVTVYYETDDTALEILPDCCELPKNPLTVVWLCEYSGPRYYTEFMQAVAVKINGKPHMFIPHMYVGPGDNPLLGNDLTGMPKKISHIEVHIANEQCYGWLERPPGIRLCTVQFAQTEPAAPPEVMDKYIWGTFATLKVVPSPNYFLDHTYEVAEVVAQKGAFNHIIHDFMGKPAIFPGKGSITFNTLSEMDPLYKIPVKKYLAAFMYYEDFITGDKGADIVYRYPVVSK